MLFSHQRWPAPAAGERPGPHPARPRELPEATLRVPDLGDHHGELLDLTARGAGVCVQAAGAPLLAPGDVVELLFGRERCPRVSTPARVVGSSATGAGDRRYEVEFIDEGDLLPQLEAFCRASYDRRGCVRLPIKGRHVGVSLRWPKGRCTATVSDLSEAGLGFSLPLASAVSLEPGQRVSTCFRLPGVPRPIEGPALVRHAVRLDGRHLFGLEFDLSDPTGLAVRMGEIRRFVAKRAELLDAWEAGWSEAG